MSLDNWVKLEVGREVRLHFREARVVEREITDPTFEVQRKVKSLLLLVDEENGSPVDKVFSVVSEKLAQEFDPYLEDRSFRDYDWVIVKDGGAFSAPRVARRVRR